MLKLNGHLKYWARKPPCTMFLLQRVPFFLREYYSRTWCRLGFMPRIFFACFLRVFCPCSMWDLSSSTRDQIHVPCIGSAEFQPLDHQESPAQPHLWSLSFSGFWPSRSASRHLFTWAKMHAREESAKRKFRVNVPWGETVRWRWQHDAWPRSFSCFLFRV